MQKEYVIQFYKPITKLLCNLSFAGQYISAISITDTPYIPLTNYSVKHVVRYQLLYLECSLAMARGI